MEFLGRIQKDGSIDFGERNRVIFQRYLAEHPGIVLKITPILPESNKQRRWFEGGLVPLIAHYQEGMSHTDQEDLRRVREWLKEEFCGEMVEIVGKIHRIAKSTKGRDALQPFLERVMNWLVENYAPPSEALDVEKFKYWRDTIYLHGGPETYIDYLCEIGILKR